MKQFLQGLLAILLMALLIECTGCASKKKDTVNAPENNTLPKMMQGKYTKTRDGAYQQTFQDANLAQYTGKTIATVRYCKNCSTSGDLLILTFMDGTFMKIYAYKYEMKLEFP